jgi:hypothetical protein
MPNLIGLWATGTIASAFVALSSSANAKVANPDLIPGKAALAISIPDGSGLVKAAEANSLFKSANRELAPYIKTKLEEQGALEKINSVEKVLGFDLSASNVIGAFKSIDAYAVPGASQDDTAVGIILGVADKKRADQLISLATLAVTEAVSGSPGSSPTTKPEPTKYKDREITKYGEEGSEAFVVKTDEMILVSNKESEIKALVDRLTEKAQDTLGANEDYKKISESLSSRQGQIFFYSNPLELNTLMESVSGNSESPVEEVTKRLQTSKFTGAAVSIEPTSVKSSGLSILNNSGLSAFLKNNPGKEIQSVKFATQDSLLFVGTSLLDTKAIGEAIDELSKVMPEVEQMKGQATQLETVLGFSIGDDLAPAVGNEIAIVVNKVDLESGPMPSVDAGIIVKVQDGSKMKKVVDALEKLGSGALSGGQGEPVSFEKEKIAGAEVKFVPVPLPIQPGFTIHNGYLVIGTTKSGIKALLEAKSGDNNLTSAEAFTKLAPAVSTTGQTVSYVNLGEIASIGLKAAKQRASEDMDAEAMFNRISNVARTLGTVGAVQQIKDGMMVSESVLDLK